MLRTVSDLIQHEAEIRTRLKYIIGFRKKMSLGIGIDRDVLDVADPDARLLKTVADGPCGKSCPMLDAAKSLLFGCGNKLTVDKEGGAGVAVIRVEAENIHVRDSRLCGP